MACPGTAEDSRARCAISLTTSKTRAYLVTGFFFWGDVS